MDTVQCAFSWLGIKRPKSERKELPTYETMRALWWPGLSRIAIGAVAGSSRRSRWGNAIAKVRACSLSISAEWALALGGIATQCIPV